MAHRSLSLKLRPTALHLLVGVALACAWHVAAQSSPAAAPVDPTTAAPRSDSSAADATNAASAVAAARQAFADALVSGQDAHPDQPAWRAAYEAADVAVSAARGEDAATLRRALQLSARVYAHIGWHSRAFRAYDEFMAEGGELSDDAVDPPAGSTPLPSDLQAFTTSANQLAFARYQAGDMQGATGYYLTVLDVHPDEPEALRWLGRIGFERGDEAGAQSAANAFGRLLELDPDDDSARYFLELSRERLEVGMAASDAFRAGVAAYEAGDLEGALASFEAAVAASPDYVEAAVWAGRTAMDLRRPQLAVGYWQQVVDARPDDQGAAWFLGLARAQVRWGVAAASAYYDGLAAYEADDLESASSSFVAATEANPEFTEAWVWAARSLQEDGEALASIPYWERVLELDPDDERAAWYLRRARTALEQGEVAGPAYFDAAAAYQVGDAEGALALLETALAEEPEFAMAWGLKGRIAFQLQRYEVAAEAYAMAAELEPGNDDYAFFADEARLLSGEEPVADDGPAPRDADQQDDGPPADDAGPAVDDEEGSEGR